MTNKEDPKWYEKIPPFSWVVAAVRFFASFSDVDLEKAGVMNDRYQDVNTLVESPDFQFSSEDPRYSNQ